MAAIAAPRCLRGILKAFTVVRGAGLPRPTGRLSQSGFADRLLTRGMGKPGYLPRLQGARAGTSTTPGHSAIQALQSFSKTLAPTRRGAVSELVVAGGHRASATYSCFRWA